MLPGSVQKQGRDQRKCSSCQSSRKLVLTVELRKKILALREIIELPPCNSTLPLDKLMIKTMKDLYDLYPQILPITLAEINGSSVSTFKVLTCFCKALEAFGEPALVDEACRVDSTKSLDKLVEHAIGVVDELIEKISERLDIMDYDYERRDFKPKAEKIGKNLKEPSIFIKHPRSLSSPPMFSVRVHAIEQLMPVELKQLAARVLQNAGDQSPRFSDQKQRSTEELDTKMTVRDRTKKLDAQNKKLESPVSDMDCYTSNGATKVEILEFLLPIPPKSCKLKDAKAAAATTIEQVPSPPSVVKPDGINLEAQATRPHVDPVHQPPPELQPNVPATGPPLPQPATTLPEGLRASPPPPKPLANRAAPPPPPAQGVPKCLRPKKTATKLKRSSYISNLYRVLKGKVEGSPLQGKSTNGKKGSAGSKVEGKQALADALIEMTKRSAYFQQIEKDVKEHAKSVLELKAAISSFKTTNVTDLLQFRKHVENVLDNLTDETQVLAKFEGFPTKKLETLRMAATLYMKLESILNDLQNLKIEPPLRQLLQRVDKFFDKMKREIDAIERTKDEDSKKFQSHGIDFDFGIVIKIKEAMVDVSSNCMEQILEERKTGKASEERAKMLWNCFQFAFRVYTFSGGHDDRADKLIQEIADEIQVDAQHCSS